MKFTDIINEKIEKGFIPYAMGWSDNLTRLKDDIPNLVKIDISKKENKNFFELYIASNTIAFGGKNMGMPKWVALDCVSLPSISLGFAVKYSKLDLETKRKFLETVPKNIEKDLHNEELFPISMYNAIPSLYDSKTFINCTLCSIMGNKGLATATMALGIHAYGAQKIKSVTQYDNHAIKVHSKFGDLSLESAQVSVHDLPNMTFVYSLNISNKEEIFSNIEKKVDIEEVKRNASFLLSHDDENLKKQMQYNLENKLSKYTILRPGIINVDGKNLIPIKEEKIDG
jgi:hypothetical protein